MNELLIKKRIFCSIIVDKKFRKFPWSCWGGLALVFLGNFYINDVIFFYIRASKTETATPKLSSPENNSISDIVIQQFPITRTISLKKNWIQHQVKTTTKKILKKAYMESKTVMLINSVLMTSLIPLYVKI